MTWFVNPAMPRVLTRITPAKLDLAMILLRERRKRVRYLGSMWHHFGDRHWLYSIMGGYNGSKIILQKTHTRHQYYHPGMYSRLGDNQWQVRSIKMKGGEYDLFGGFTRNRWDQTINGTNAVNDSGLKHHFRGLGKDEAIEFLEQWGLKYVIIDELRKPNLVDTKYWQHKLYVHNFPWIKNPVTNATKGDADHWWKGDEKIDYGSYGATSKIGNSFTSLWNNAVAELEEPVAAVTAKASKKGGKKTAESA
jgi:hypothetical protein